MNKKKRNVSFNFLNRFMILQFILMLVLSIIITRKVSESARQNATAQLSAIANERALIVSEYVDNAESKLKLFSINKPVTNVLASPNNQEAINEARSYNTLFASEIADLDSLFIAGWDGKVYAHNRSDFVGKTPWSDEELADILGNILNAGDEVYNAGIMVSPSSSQNVLTMFKGIYKGNGNPIGFVCLTVKSDRIMNKLSDIKAPGLENSTYTMMDVIKAAYVFDQDDPSNAGKPVVLPDLTRTCEEYRTGKNTDISTTYEYALPGMGSFVGASVWMPERNWILMMNDRSSEVYSLVYVMRTFLGIFSALILALMVLFAFLNKKQEKVNMKLVASVERMNQAKQSLNSAMFNDVLTEVGNRVKLAISLSDVTDGKTNPYYFIMFNLMEFSSINTAFGSDTGDDMLVKTASQLQNSFPNGSVFRTGSDEFVVMIRSENGSPRTETLLTDVDNVLRTLIAPQNIEGVGALYPKYKVAVIKKTTGIDASVITILKEMTNAKGEATVGAIDYSDLSE